MIGGFGWWRTKGRFGGILLWHTTPVNQKIIQESIESVLSVVKSVNCPPPKRLLVRLRPPGWSERGAKEYLVLRHRRFLSVEVVVGTREETRQRLVLGLSAGILAEAGGRWAKMARNALVPAAPKAAA